jgi:hypothetical protein
LIGVELSFSPLKKLAVCRTNPGAYLNPMKRCLLIFASNVSRCNPFPNSWCEAKNRRRNTIIFFIADKWDE